MATTNQSRDEFSFSADDHEIDGDIKLQFQKSQEIFPPPLSSTVPYRDSLDGDDAGDENDGGQDEGVENNDDDDDTTFSMDIKMVLQTTLEPVESKTCTQLNAVQIVTNVLENLNRIDASQRAATRYASARVVSLEDSITLMEPESQSSTRGRKRTREDTLLGDTLRSVLFPEDSAGIEYVERRTTGSRTRSKEGKRARTVVRQLEALTQNVRYLLDLEK